MIPDFTTFGEVCKRSFIVVPDMSFNVEYLTVSRQIKVFDAQIWIRV